ncbi:MAG: CRISPR-associated endonuclease Cas2 [Desulforegulaceae bacterium]|nr:CRISPR-associated endonuclease Cas2 [Desulforegulaceae bacterium]
MLRTLVWIIYDITDDKIRGKIAKECKKSGLTRVQKSVFLGRIDWNRFDELAERFDELIIKKTDSVYIFPFCQEDFKKIRVLGQGFDKKYVNDEILAKFF